MSSKRKQYTSDNLEAAINDVKHGLSKNAASKKHNVPRATIQFHLKQNAIKTKPGPNPILTDEEESTLENWMIDSCNKGFPRRIEDVILSVKEFLQLNERANPFKNNTPGIGWYRAFLRRHPQIAKRTSEAVTAASSCVSEKYIRCWFDQIGTYLRSEDNFNILQDPNRVFNAEETGFLLNLAMTKVLGPRGAEDIYETEQGNSQTSITVMFSFSAAGLMVPPMIVYPYQRIPAEIISSVSESWGIGCSDTGWMETQVFYNYIANVFGPFIKEKNIKTPVILFVDGHRSHLTYHISELCTKLGIILIALYPNATRILQPAEVAGFRPIKEGWRKGVFEWSRKHPYDNLKTEQFFPLLKIVLDNHIKPDTFINGFRACGLFPWNPDAVNFTKCLGGTNIKNNTNRIPSELCKIPKLDFETFTNLVGEELLQKFNNIENECTEVNNNELFILFRMWNEVFHKGVPQTAFSGKDKEEGETSFPIQFSEIPEPTDMPNNEDSEKAQSITPESSQESENKPTFSKEIYDQSISVVQSCEIGQKDEPLPSISGVNLNHDTEGKYNTPKIDIIPVKRGLFQLPTKPNQDRETSSSQLHDILLLPESPKIKGKRQIEQLSFVITSSAWNKIHEEKATKKIEEEEKNIEKKRKLEEKKEMGNQHTMKKRSKPAH